MLGNFAVGKTSLVRRYVTGVFDAAYQTTVGVKIDTCHVNLPDNLPTSQLKMIIWDLAGAATLTPHSRAYIWWPTAPARTPCTQPWTSNRKWPGKWARCLLYC